MRLPAPIIRSLCAMLVGLTTQPVFAARNGTHQDAGTVAEQYLLAAANQEREQRGLAPLHRDPHLARAAAQHALLMASQGTISHQFAAEPALASRGSEAGVAFSAISENVAEAPSAVQIHDMWMHSPHHRENLLNPAADSVGISVIARAGELYAVEDFAKTVHSVSFSDQELAIGQLVARSGLTIAEDPEDIAVARRTCSMSNGYAGTRRPWFIMRFTSDSLSRLPDQLQAKINSGRYREAAVGACSSTQHSYFTSYSIAVLLYP